MESKTAGIGVGMVVAFVFSFVGMAPLLTFLFALAFAGIVEGCMRWTIQ